jgi:hypothetical protein
LLFLLLLLPLLVAVGATGTSGAAGSRVQDTTTCNLVANPDLTTDDMGMPSMQQVKSVDDLPSFDYGDEVEFYLLESVFPTSTPMAFKQTMGAAFNAFAVTNAGLGIWNKDTSEKLTVQLVALSSYYSALLPSVQDDVLVWANNATILYSPSVDLDYWTNSQLLARSTGTAYESLKKVAQQLQREGTFSRLQPVYVGVEKDQMDDAASSSHHLSEVLAPVNSYTLVWRLLKELVDSSVQLHSFTSTFNTRFVYVADAGGNVDSDMDLEVLPISGPANADTMTAVASWYSDLQACYCSAAESILAAQANVSDQACGGTLFMDSITACYSPSPHAYLFRDESSVYKVPLSFTADNQSVSPLLERTAVSLPHVEDTDGVHFHMADYLAVAALCLLALAMTVRLLVFATQRREVVDSLVPDKDFLESTASLLARDGLRSTSSPAASCVSGGGVAATSAM